MDLTGYAPAIRDAVTREYPHGWRHSAAGPVTLAARDAHPAFYGCYDWHSAVHMHWALVRLLPMRDDAASRRVLDDHLTAANIAGEVAYFEADRLFERPYGWGWTLQLAEELAGWDEPWADALRPLADLVTARFLTWLPGMARPVRAGMHSNSAFALSRTLDWARRLEASGDGRLLAAITDAAGRWFGGDTDYDGRFEPDGWDFLSPGLAEIDLMGDLLPSARFRAWYETFLPGGPGAWASPVTPGDRSDGQAAHLDGLNLHRALVLGRLADRLDDEQLRSAARRHASAGLEAVIGGDYMSEHWLASFALLVVTQTTGVVD